MKAQAFILILIVGLCNWVAGDPPENGFLAIIDDSSKVAKTRGRADILSSLNIEDIEKLTIDSSAIRQNLDPSNATLPLFSSVSPKLTHPESFPAIEKSRSMSKLHDILNSLKYSDISENPIEELKRELFFNLPKSVTITFGIRKRRLPLQLPKVQYDVYRPSDESYDKYTDEDFIAKNPLPDDFRAKICKTNDGLVQSVEYIKENETLGDCSEVIVVHEYGILDLGRLGLREFQRGWYKLPKDTIMKIDMSENDITDITPELLNDLPSGLISVNFAYNEIGIIKKNIINNSYIRKLEFDHNLLKTIENNAFQNTHLASLKARKNRLDDLGFVRTVPKSIKILDFSGNSIFRIPANTFKGLAELLRIRFIESRIQVVEPGAFEDQGQLLALDLSYNRIRNLSSGVFRGLKSLRELNLSHNRIKEIGRNSFSGLKKLFHLSINIGHNQIDAIEEGSFSNLNGTVLYLDHNKIRRDSIATGAFTGSAVKSLKLNNNLIARIDGELLYGISELYSLYLDDNQIAEIKKGDIKNMENVIHLSLDRNPLRHLENGAFYGLTQQHVTVSLREVPIEDIQAGVFDDA